MRFATQGMLIFSCLWLNQACAEHYSPFATYYPGVSITGTAGTVINGYADVMIPLMGDQTDIYYLDPQGMYRSNNQYSGSVGAGGRWLTQNAGILGAYVFGDYNRSKYDNAFWFISPGVEHLGDDFDFSANLYFPVIRQHAETTSEFASALGDDQYVTFQGHSEMDRMINQLESTGFGADVQIGYRLPQRFMHNTRLYLGGYYFEPEDANTILGAAIRAEIPVNSWLSVLASESYDSEYNNTLKAGLTVALGGRSTSYNYSGDLRTRMLDPIQRNLIAVAGGSGNSQPIVHSDQTTLGDFDVLLDDITFFLPDEILPPIQADATAASTFQDGTFEHPYLGMTQEDVDSANALGNRIFYINTGSYTPSAGIVLENDSLYGRDNEFGTPFMQPATGNARPNFFFDSSGFILNGKSNRIDSLKMHGTGSGNGLSASYVTDTSDTVIDIENTEISGFLQGVSIENFSRYTLDVIFNQSDIINNVTHGVRIDSTENIKQTNVRINASHFDNNGGNGFFVDNTGAFCTPQTVSETNFTANNSTFDRNDNNGLQIQTNTSLNSNQHINNITLLNSTFNDNIFTGFEMTDNGTIVDNNINISQSSFSDGKIGFYIYNATSSGNTKINITDSEMVNNTLYGLYSLFYDDSTTTEIQRSNFSNNGTQGVVVEFDGGPSSVNIAHSIIDGNTFGGMGIYVYNTNTNLTIADSIVSNNGQDGLYLHGHGNLDLNIARTTFDSNSNNGVNMLIFDQHTANVIVTNSAINNNTIGFFTEASGLATVNVDIQNSSFNQNSSAGLEGVIYNPGVIMNLTATNSTFSGSFYGVLGLNAGTPFNLAITLNNPTFSSNTYDTNLDAPVDLSPQPIAWTIN